MGINWNDELLYVAGNAIINLSTECFVYLIKFGERTNDHNNAH